MKIASLLQTVDVRDNGVCVWSGVFVCVCVGGGIIETTWPRDAVADRNTTVSKFESVFMLSAQKWLFDATI